MKREDIRPRDENGDPHGYWEIYYINDELWYKGLFIHGERDRLFEYYAPNGEIRNKQYRIR